MSYCIRHRKQGDRSEPKRGLVTVQPMGYGRSDTM